MTIIWCMVSEIWSMTDRIFCHLDSFLPFYPSKNPKNQHFLKIKRASGDIIIWHMCTINDIHIMYGFWDIKCDKNRFLSFWTVFYPFNPLTTWKIKILKNWKKHLEISCCSWDMACNRCIDFLFWTCFLPFYLLNSPKNQNFKKLKKIPGDIIILP